MSPDPPVAIPGGLSPHWRGLLVQHAAALGNPRSTVRAGSHLLAQVHTGTFDQLIFVIDAAHPLPLGDPGVGVEIFLLNCTPRDVLRIRAPLLGTRGVRVFDRDGRLVSDRVLTLDDCPLTIPPAGYARF